jgi:dCTP deaminase
MSGILVSQTIRQLAEKGAIQALAPLQPGQIQPSSIDLRLGARIWQLQVSFLPGARGVERKLGSLATGAWRLDRDEPLVLHRGGVYLAEIEEVLELPDDGAKVASPL